MVKLKITEDQIQQSLVDYCDIKNIPIFAIPNAQKLSFLDRKKASIVMNKLKKTGLKNGIPDLFVPMPNNNYHGLFIELKSASGKLSDNQKIWIDKLNINGYKAVVCYSLDDAIEKIKLYLI